MSGLQLSSDIFNILIIALEKISLFIDLTDKNQQWYHFHCNESLHFSM